MRSADVVVSTPRHEPARLAPLEAMSCARPLVCSAVDAKPAVADGTTGLLVPPDDPASLGAAVRRFLDDRSFAEQVGAAGRREAADYDWKNVAARMEAVYEQTARCGRAVAQAG